MARADDSVSRVGYLSHWIDEKDLKPGDHIYCIRSIYNHQGIYIGERGCEVIHFSGDDKGSLEKKKGKQDDATMRQVTSLANERDKWPEGSAKYKEFQQQIDKIYQDHNRPVCIKSSTLKGFLHGATLRLVSYGSSGFKRVFSFIRGSNHTVNAMPPSETIELAKHFLNNPEEWGNYGFLSNNCETFACFCKTGLLNIAAQARPDRSALSEWFSTPCRNAEEALEKYRKIY